jgi:hypothetical protein
MLTAIVVGGLAAISADPDLWGHLRFGQDIVAAGTIPRVDTYSFTSDIPWVNHEWLAEVLMYLAWSAGGSLGLVGFKLVFVLGTIGLLVLALEKSGLPLPARDVCIALVAIALAPLVKTVRPQLFSLLLFTTLLATLRSVDRGRRGAIAAVPVIMLLWCNLHGGWLVGMAVVGLWLVFELFDPRVPRGVRGGFLLAGGLAAGATLVNPYGVGLWVFLWNTVGLSRPDITEWQPIWGAPFAVAVIWLGVMAAAAVIVMKRGSVKWPYLASLLLLGFASIRVVRLIPFFGLAAAYWLAPSLGAGRGMSATPASNNSRRGHDAYWLAALALIVLSGGITIAVTNRCIQTVDGWRAPDGEAARFIAANRLSGRMVTWFDWGEYAIWHLSPAVKVSMDGRRETVYSDSVRASHRSLYVGEARGLAYLDSLKPDYVWLPAGFAVVPKLEGSRWHTIFRSAESVILSRNPEQVVMPPARFSGPVCFPGP